MHKSEKITKIKSTYLKNENAFTLVEMMVVMSITAMMFLLGASSMYSAGKQARLKDAAKTLQSNIRLAANNSISVSPDIDDPSTPSKAWAIVIPQTSGGAGATNYKLYSYISDTERSFKEIPLENGITATKVLVRRADGSLTGNDSNYQYLLFSSPFATFHFRRVASGTVEGELTFNTDAKGIVTPTGTDASLEFSSVDIILKDQSGKTKTVSVDTKTGESSIK